MNAFQVKTYLFPDNEKPSYQAISKVSEIRRFNLASNNSIDGLYKSLIDKIQTSYANIISSKDQLRTYYQDDENELIGFTTDSELQYAFDLQTALNVSKPYANSSNVFKVYISRGQTGSKSFDNCDFGKQFETESQLHRGIVCDGCNGSIIGVRHKCSTCLDYDLCSSCEKKGAHKDTNHTFIKINKPGLFRGRCPYGGFRRFGHCHRQRHHENSSSGSASANSFQEKINEFLPFLSSNIPLVTDPEQLKNVGECLKNFLDPFGIDVDYYVDTLNRATSGQSQKDETKDKQNEKTTKETNESSQINVDSNEKKEFFKDEERKMNIDDEPVLTSVDKSENKTSESSITAPSAPSLEEKSPQNSSEASLYSRASEALKQIVERNNKAENEDQTVTPKPTIENRENPRSSSENFQFVDIEKELKIIKAIEQLKSMGYSDDGGWLTRLVSTKEGNINEVLDAISPFNFRNN